MKKAFITVALFLAAQSVVTGITPSLLAETTAPAMSEIPTAQAPPLIQCVEPLSLAQALAITRDNQPAIQAAQAGVAAGQSRIGQAQSAYYPQVNGAASYDRSSPQGNIYGIADDKAYDRVSAGVGADQLLYDFGRTSSRVEIQKSNLDSARADLNTALDLAAYQTKLAYYDELKIARNVLVAKETVKQFELHLSQAKGFYEAGVKPKYDVTKAEVDLSRARLSQIQVENNLRLARVTLNNAMGLPDAPDYSLEDTLDSTSFDLPFAKALPLALAHRPDLQALLLKKQAADQSVELARTGYYPTLTGNAGAGYSGDTETLDEGWNVGIALAIPIFNGHLTRHQIDEAKANSSALAANVTALQQAIHKNVQQAYLNLQEAEERIATTRLVIVQAEENSRIAAGRYSAGVGSPVEVTDADTLLVQARADHNQALYDYRIAQTGIEQSIGLTSDSDRAGRSAAP